MTTRCHVHEEAFDASPETLFALLTTPSAIRDWWSASRVIVVARAGGSWAATWGADEDHPDYVTSATMSEFDPPRRMVLCDYRYQAASGALPFDAEFVTSFEVRASEGGAVLRVEQDGFPLGEAADEFLAGCETGWRDTFAGIRRCLASRDATR